MSLADKDHILTVLGSRAGFSAEIRVVANVTESSEEIVVATQKMRHKTVTTSHLDWTSSSRRTV